jgi:hypothetical protein
MSGGFWRGAWFVVAAAMACFLAVMVWVRANEGAAWWAVANTVSAIIWGRWALAALDAADPS